MTPVVTDLQLLPGQWKRPNSPFVSHPLFAASTNNGGIACVKTTEARGNTKGVENTLAAPPSKRRMEYSKDSLSGTWKGVGP